MSIWRRSIHSGSPWPETDADMLYSPPERLGGDSLKRRPWTASETEFVSGGGDESATIIGSDLILTGEMVSEENIHLQGRVEGNISTSGSLFVAPGGHVKGDITAENVVVEGSIEGT